MAAMPGRFSMPARRRRSRSSPTSTGRSRARLDTTRKPVPGGPYTLWPLATSRSAPSSATSRGSRPRVWQASTSSSAPCSWARVAASPTGWMVPTSWLACWRQTSRVSSRTAAASSAGSTRPVWSTPTSVTSNPWPARARAGASTEVCSTADTTRWRRRLAALASPVTARLAASVPPEVSTSSSGAAPTAAASCSRERSSSSRARRARPYSRDGSPKASRASSSAARARGCSGVVEAASR